MEGLGDVKEGELGFGTVTRVMHALDLGREGRTGNGEGSA